MQNWFHHIFNNRICMGLLVFAIVGLVSTLYVSSVFAPTGSNWQTMQKNSISSANQTTSSGLIANNTTALTNSSQLSNR
jgi:hypothetical protein